MTQPRIPPVTDPSPEVAEILGKTAISDGPPLNIFATLAHHPRLLKRFNVLGGLFLGRGVLPAREREIVILRTGWRTRCEYEFGQHVVLGRRAGLTDEEIRLLAREDGEWPAEDAALVRLADELHATRDVSEDLWAELSAHWNHAELLELVMLAGFYGMVSGFLNAARVQREPGLPGFPEGQDA
ncbi:MAG TPA: carboxymuconolactone decarboxylase family protein [Candidatus Dormibacteraeota bacterium]|nr:carboxymuconolactone decarboxylase family protein [Candidatus Dormibacteraeota bacterium]